MPSLDPTPTEVRWTIRIAVVLGVAIAIGFAYDITLWDWLKLLIVPAVIAAGGIWFNQAQRKRELKIDENQRKQELKIAEQRTQDEALQAYLGEISQLLTDKERPLDEARPRDTLSAVARALTLAVLDRIEGHRKRQVLQFLYESNLITKDHTVLSLRAANLKQAFLVGLNLARADLSGAQLDEANLFQAVLQEADLREANLIRANLEGADLRKADLREARMHHANLDRAQTTELSTQLAGVGLYSTVITNMITQQQTFLDSATMPDGKKFESWLTTHAGKIWLIKFLSSPEGQTFLTAPDAQTWFITWLQTPEGQSWINTSLGQTLFESWFVNQRKTSEEQNWINTPIGQSFFSISKEGRGENGENSDPT